MEERGSARWTSTQGQPVTSPGPRRQRRRRPKRGANADVRISVVLANLFVDQCSTIAMISFLLRSVQVCARILPAVLVRSRAPPRAPRSTGSPDRACHSAPQCLGGYPEITSERLRRCLPASQVAAVCRMMCGVSLPGAPARAATVLHDRWSFSPLSCTTLMIPAAKSALRQRRKAGAPERKCQQMAASLRWRASLHFHRLRTPASRSNHQ